MQLVDAARLMLDDMNNRTEKKIRTLKPQYLALKTETQLPLLINTNYIIQQWTDVPLTVDLYSTDSGLIFRRQLTLPISAEC